MPNKGLYTQGAAILFEKPVGLDALSSALDAFDIVKRNEGCSNWVHGGPSLIVAFRPVANGYISVDVVDRAWPDDMGHPGTAPELFGAWAMGAFGPLAFPQALRRSTLQSWHWRDAGQAVARHCAFVRIRASYVFGANPGAAVMPVDYDPVDELLTTTAVARDVLSAPGAICYFNPNGESLWTATEVDDLLGRHSATGLLPYELWSNVRVFRLAEHESWTLVDTVGMGQLDAPDHEAVFAGNYDISEVAGFVRNAAAYVVTNGPIVADGDTIDGPGGVVWQGATFESPLFEPPRTVIRWFPVDGTQPPRALIERDRGA